MKKIIYSIVICLMLTCTTLLGACGKGNPTAIELKDGTLETMVVLNEDLNYSNVVLNVTYENGKTEEVAKNDEMTFTGFDKTKLGNQTLKISYKDLSINVEIFVVEDETETYEINGFEKPYFYSFYEDQKVSEDIAEDATHFDRNAVYKVGDDNEFIFLPEITGLKEVEGDLPITIEIDKYVSKVVVERLDGENYIELNEDIADYVEVDNVNSSFDFTEEAIGETFRITVSPYVESYVDPITFVVEVVNGWNAYDAMDLSRIDNAQGTASAWASRKDGGYNEEIQGIVLHNNITLEVADLPEAYFYNDGDADTTEANENTMRVWKSMYTRNIPADSVEPFSIYGNYFNIDAHKLPLTIKRADDAYGHSAIFSFGGDNNGHPTTLQGGAYIENLKLIGNSKRDENPIYQGGLTAINTTSKNIVINNCITHNFATHIVSTEMPGVEEDNFNSVTVKKSKLIDSFSSLVYAARTKNFMFEDSLLKGSGGPAVMGTHNDPAHDATAFSNVTFKNTDVKCYIVGTEAWFGMNDAADIATYLKGLDQLFLGTSTGLKNAGIINYTKSMIVPEGEEYAGKINFLDVIMIEGNPLTNTTPIKGALTVDKDGQTSTQDMSDLSALIGAVPALAQKPFFKSNGVTMTIKNDQSGLELLSGNSFIDVTALLTKAAAANAGYGTLTAEEQTQFASVLEFFEGHTMHIYIGGGTLGASADFNTIAA